MFAGMDNAGLLDFVAAWYVLAARYLRGAATPSPSGGGLGWEPATHAQEPPLATTASPHPHLGAGGETPPLFKPSSSALTELEPQPSAPKGEGV